MKPLSIIWLLLYVAIGHAQVREQHQLLARLTQTVISADSYYNASPLNQADPIRTNSIYTTQLSGEYGLTKRLTVTALLPVFVRTIVNDLEYNQSGNVSPGGARNSLGDAEIGLRYALLHREQWQVICFGILGLPLGERGDVTLETNLATGDGEFNQMIGAEVYKPISSFSLSGYVLFNNRTDGYSNEIRYGFEAAYAGSKYKLKARYRVIESLFNDVALTSGNGIFSNHREAYMPGVEFQYHIRERGSIFASADFITAGRNTLNAPLWGVGIEIKL